MCDGILGNQIDCLVMLILVELVQGFLISYHEKHRSDWTWKAQRWMGVRNRNKSGIRKVYCGNVNRKFSGSTSQGYYTQKEKEQPTHLAVAPPCTVGSMYSGIWSTSSASISNGGPSGPKSSGLGGISVLEIQARH